MSLKVPRVPSVQKPRDRESESPIVHMSTSQRITEPNCPRLHELTLIVWKSNSLRVRESKIPRFQHSISYRFWDSEILRFQESKSMRVQVSESSKAQRLRIQVSKSPKAQRLRVWESTSPQVATIYSSALVQGCFAGLIYNGRNPTIAHNIEFLN
jgi:hypothetical protein